MISSKDTLSVLLIVGLGFVIVCSGVELGEKCDNDADCNGVPNAECIVPPEMIGDKRCRCKLGQFVESENTPGTCIPVRHSVGSGEGAKCESNIQCTTGLGVNSTCEGRPDGHCKCVGPNGFYGKMCHDASKLDGKCEGDVNCFAGINTLAECRAKRCKCRKNAVEGDDRLCYEPRILGGACETNAICEANIGNGVECKSQKCTCKEDREATEDGKKCNGAMTFVGNTIFLFGAFLIKNMF